MAGFPFRFPPESPLRAYGRGPLQGSFRLTSAGVPVDFTGSSACSHPDRPSLARMGGRSSTSSRPRPSTSARTLVPTPQRSHEWSQQ